MSDEPAGGADTHWSQVTQRRYEPDGRRELTTEIVYTIAEAEGVSPDAVKSPPLYEVVDVPAIEEVFFGLRGAGDSRQGVGTVEFRYAEYLVNVRSDGWIEVSEPAETDSP